MTSLRIGVIWMMMGWAGLCVAQSSESFVLTAGTTTNGTMVLRNDSDAPQSVLIEVQDLTAGRSGGGASRSVGAKSLASSRLQPVVSEFKPLPESTKVVPNEVLVRFDTRVAKNPKDCEAILAKAGGGAVAKTYQLVSGLALVSVEAGDVAALNKVLAKYHGVEGILYAEPNYVFKVNRVPDDPRFSEQWVLEKIRASQAWEQTTGSEQVVVAVIDTGVDYTHPELAANMWVNPGEIPDNGIDDDGNGYVDDVHGINVFAGASRPGDPMDDMGHGTFCAGEIAACGNNALGVCGVTWNTKVMALKFLGSEGEGSLADALTCYDYAMAQGVRVLSNSYGSPTNIGIGIALQEAITAVKDAGALFVVAAGNNSRDLADAPFFPTVCNGVLSVMSTSSDDGRSLFSNYGATLCHMGAPGERLVGLGLNHDYTVMSGTSMACPLVAGAAALLLAKDPSLSPDDLMELLMDSGDPVLAGDCISGKRLNLEAAFEALAAKPKWLPMVSADPIVIAPHEEVAWPYTISAVGYASGEYQGELHLTWCDEWGEVITVQTNAFALSVVSDSLQVAPVDVVRMEGVEGGPFTIRGVAPMLGNLSDEPVLWQVTSNKGLVVATPDAEILDAGATQTLSVAGTTLAAELKEGVYADTLILTNRATGAVHRWPIELTVAHTSRTLYVDEAQTAVPADGLAWGTAFTTLQEAVDVAGSGDTIRVAPGNYVGVSALRYDLSIISEAGYAQTFISQGSLKVGVALKSRASRLEGFTIRDITNGNNVGGVLSGVVDACVIKNCRGFLAGGCLGAQVRNSVIKDCRATDAYAGGGATGGSLLNCTVYANRNSKAQVLGGVGGVVSAALTNCVVYMNTDAQGSHVNYSTDCTFVTSCTQPLPAGEGNIDGDPQLSGELGALPLVSCCVDQGMSDWAFGETDLAGNPRVVGLSVDMGAFECQELDTAVPAVPQGVMASQGLFAEAVLVAWEPVDTARRYLVYRTESMSFADAVCVGETGEPTFMDTTAEPLTVYTYKVSAKNSSGEGALSLPVYGFAVYSMNLVTPEQLPVSGLRDAAYQYSLVAENGVYPYSWSLVSQSYSMTTEPSTFTTDGERQGGAGDDVLWTLKMPFVFPFYGQNYTHIYISDNGYICFENKLQDSGGVVELLKRRRMIAPLWRDMMISPTDAHPEYDLVLSDDDESLTVCWRAAYWSDNANNILPANFSVRLYKTGKIVFAYGEGNSLGGVTGISAGDGLHYTLAERAPTMSASDADDVVFEPQGLPDGLTLSRDGTISGVPSVAGDFTFATQVVDASGSVLERMFTISIEDIEGAVAPVSFMPASGTTFTNAPFAVTLACTNEDAVITYTLDGSDPATSPNAFTYTEPLSLVSQTHVRAFATKEGMIPSTQTQALYTREYTFESALDCDVNGSEPLEFVTEGDSDWFLQTMTFHTGGVALQSGPVANNQSAILKTTVVGPGQISFWWKTSSEEEYDELSVYVDGVPSGVHISGETDWQHEALDLSGGEHVVTWVYHVDVSSQRGVSCGWVDNVVYTTVPIKTFPTNVYAGAQDVDGTFDVWCNGDWSVQVDADWVTLYITHGFGDQSVGFQLAPNTTGAERVATFTITTPAGDSTQYTLTQLPSTVPPSTTGTHYGIFVGINLYSCGYSSLKGCVYDATNLFAMCTTAGAWTEANCTKHLDYGATKATVRTNLLTLAASAQPGDTVFYFQSSHGGNHKDESGAYTMDVALAMTDEAYEDYELAEDLAHFQSGVRVVLFIDTCHSAGLFEPTNTTATRAQTLAQVQSSLSVRSTTSVQPVSPAVQQVPSLAERVTALMQKNRTKSKLRAKAEGRTAIDPSEIGWIAAADYDQFSWDSDTGAVFTGAAVQGWTTGIADRNVGSIRYGNYDSVCSFYELWNYAKDIAQGNGIPGTANYTTAMCYHTNVLHAVIAGTYVASLAYDTSAEMPVPTAWIQRYFPGTTATNRLANGYTVAEAYLVGTTNATDTLSITEMDWTTLPPTATFTPSNAMPQVHYTLQGITNIQDTIWGAADSGHQYFRVHVEWQNDTNPPSEE